MTGHPTAPARAHPRRRARRARVGRPVVVLLVGVLLAGCGSFGGVRDFVDDTFTFQGRRGDTAIYASPAPVGPTSATITDAVEPAARGTDGTSEYLRYDEDVVVISSAGAGSTVRIEDVDGRYSRGFYAFLGPGFRPGSPAGGAGGPGGVK